MSGESVLNIFEQPGVDRDNKLVIGGNMESLAGSTMTVNGALDLEASSTVTVKGALDLEASSTVTVKGALESNGGQDLKTKLVTVAIGDISSTGSIFVVPGIAGTIVKISNVIDGAITVADAGLTFEIGGTAITDAAIEIANAGSAAGVVDQSTPSALNVVTASEAIEIVKDGDSTDASNGVVTFEILPS